MLHVPLEQPPRLPVNAVQPFQAVYLHPPGRALHRTGKEGEGLIITTNLNRDDKRPVVKDFLAAYRKTTKIEPDMVGASAYDAFMLIVDSMKKANSASNASGAPKMSPTNREYSLQFMPN